MARIRVLLQTISKYCCRVGFFDDGFLKIDFAQRQVFLNQQLISLTRNNINC
jgi:two-component system KDP operon response regulator KdpE